MALDVMMFWCLQHPAGDLTLPAAVTFALSSLLLAPSAHWTSATAEAQEVPVMGIHSIDAS